VHVILASISLAMVRTHVIALLARVRSKGKGHERWGHWFGIAERGFGVWESVNDGLFADGNFRGMGFDAAAFLTRL
jgi:hypothetical protein